MNTQEKLQDNTDGEEGDRDSRRGVVLLGAVVEMKQQLSAHRYEEEERTTSSLCCAH